MRSVSTATCALAFAVILASASSGWSDHDDSGCDPHPANDDFASAAEIPFVPYAVAGTTGCATAEPDEPGTWCEDVPPSQYQASVWYRYRPSETSRVTAHVFGLSIAPHPPNLLGRVINSGPFASVVQVYEGESFDAKKYACDVAVSPLYVSQASFLAVERKTYFIQVHPVIEGPRGEGQGDFLLVLAPRVETDPREILP